MLTTKTIQAVSQKQHVSGAMFSFSTFDRGIPHINNAIQL
jgi:hypothetical protein